MMDSKSDEEYKAAAFFIMRMFFAQFWVLQFWGKMYDHESGMAAFRNLGIWAKQTTTWMTTQTILPVWAVYPYTFVLPYVELLIGILLLLGIQLRRTLIFSAFLVISLDIGLMMKLKHDIAATNTIYLIATLLALRWVGHSRWTVEDVIRDFGRRGPYP